MLPGSIQVTQRPGPSYYFDGKLWILDAKAIREQQLASIKTARDEACVQPVLALGHTWQADRVSKDLLNDTITLVLAGGSLPPVWRDAHNNDMPISSIAELVAIAEAMREQVQTAYSVSWAEKNKIK